MIDSRAQRWMRFIVGGGVNTGFTYLVYLGLSEFLIYQLAYMIAYALGIVFSYWFNSSVVFRVSLSLKSFLAYPIVYIFQYLMSAFFLGGLVEFLLISETIAPLVVAVAMIPITYLMSKFVLGGKTQKETLPPGDAAS